MKKIYFVFSVFIVVFSFKSRAQCSTPSNVPYFQGFQSITSLNQLPTCWAISNPSTCMTYTAPGSASGAAFYYLPAGTSYFYSNGIQLYAGIVYSVSAFYTAGFNPTNTWSDFSLLLNQTQSAVGASTLVSTNGFALASVMTNLSNTFTVANSAVYYIAVKGTSNGTGSSQYLSWDDLSITIPCQISPNSPSVSILASSTVICSGTAPTFTAVGADTYTWNTGATTSTAIISSGNVNVTGTKTLTGCSSSASLNVSVNPSPNVIIYAGSSSICSGSSIILSALGASSYTWSTGQQTNSITVTPSVVTSYSVIGSNNYSCTSNAVQLIQLNPLPTVTVLSAMPSNTICNGELDTLYASGANTYTWTYSQNVSIGSQLIVTPSVTTIYTVSGKDNNGCTSQTSFVLNVNGCTGLNQLLGTNDEIKLSPNPFQNEFLISTGSYDIKTIVITDINGRVILDLITKEEQLIVNTRYYAQGIYYVKILSGEKNSVLKVIKN